MINIYNIDCIEAMVEMKDKAFDLAIVDPPYSDNTENMNVGLGNRNFNYSKFRRPATAYFQELFRVSVNQIIWGFNYMSDMLPVTSRFICWNKHQNGHFSECELAWCSLGKTRIYDRAYQFDIGNKIHPTQKPIALYKWLLTNYAHPGQSILDTHLGSGSIAIACHDLGFDLTGYELDADYYRAATERLEQHQSQASMFLPVQAVPSFTTTPLL